MFEDTELLLSVKAMPRNGDTLESHKDALGTASMHTCKTNPQYSISSGMRGRYSHAAVAHTRARSR